MAKKFISFLFALLMAFLYAPKNTFAYDSEIQSTGDPVPLKEGNYEKWIDRIYLPDYALEFYDSLIEGSDNDYQDDWLINVEGESKNSKGEYVRKLAEFSGYSTDESVLLESIESEYTFAKTALRAAMDAFMMDHPEVFWISGDTQFMKSSGYEETDQGFKYEYTVYLILKTESYDIRIERYQDSVTIRNSCNAFQKQVQSIISECGKDARSLNHWLTENNGYNEIELANGDTPFFAHTSYSAVMGNRGNDGPICEGYAKAYKVLCDAANIPCVLNCGTAITSNGSAKEHMWNYVKLGAGWFGVDVTWNDPLIGGEDTEGTEDYLFLGADTIRFGYSFIGSHPVRNCVSANGVQFTNGPALSNNSYNFFIIGRDSNNFNHNNDDFGMRDDSMGCLNYTDDSKGTVYATSKSLFARFAQSMNPFAISSLLDKMNEKWVGSCLGLTVSLGLAQQSRIDIAKLTADGQGPVVCYNNLLKPAINLKLRNLINYYHLMHYTDLKKPDYQCQSIFPDKVINWAFDSVEDFWPHLIEEASAAASEEIPVLITFGYKTTEGWGGHAVLVVGYDDQDPNEYILKLYDCNYSTPADTVHGSDYLYLHINKNDLSEFHIELSNGAPKYISSNNWNNIKMWGTDVWNSIDAANDWIGSLTAADQIASATVNETHDVNDNNCVTVQVPANSSFVMKDEKGHSLIYDGNQFSTDFEITDCQVCGDEEFSYSLTLSNTGETLEFTDLSSEFHTAVEFVDGYSSVTVKNASSLSVTSEKISIPGSFDNFAVGIGVNTEYGLLKATGESGMNAEFAKTDEGAVLSGDSLKEVNTYRFGVETDDTNEYEGDTEKVEINGSDINNSCGEHAKWKFEDGILTIYGSGEMSWDTEDSPWSSYTYKIESVRIEEGITNVHDYAFKHCENMKTCLLPDTVTTIGKYAFWYDSSLVYVTFPESLKTIKQYAFCRCTSLESIELNEGLETVEGLAFFKCESLSKIVIPSSVKSIGSEAFDSCLALTRVEMNEGVESIGTGVFFGCDNLEKVIIPSTLKTFGSSSFYGCTSLITAGPAGSDCNIEYSWTDEIPGNVFSNCPCLKEVTIVDSVSKIGSGAFAKCPKLETVSIPEHCERIGSGAFSNCELLKSLTIPESVSYIGSSFISGCTSMESLYFIYNLPEVESDFLRDVTLTAYYPEGNPTWTEDILKDYGGTITWKTWTSPIRQSYTVDELEVILDQNGYPYTGETIRPKITVKCNGRVLTSDDYTLSFGENILVGKGTIVLTGKRNYSGERVIEFEILPYCGEHITWVLKDGNLIISGYGRMYDFSEERPPQWTDGLKSVTISDNIENIGAYAFSKCKTLTEITFGKDIADIGRYAFYHSGLKEVTLPEACQKIGSYAFYSCDAMTDLHMNEELKEIDYSAFAYCSGLKQINLSDGVETISEFAFYGCKSAEEISLGKGLLEISDHAFRSCASLTSMIFPESVQKIGADIFVYCDALEYVRFTGHFPELSPETFSERTITAYYPDKDETWTEDKLLNYGGILTWRSWDSGEAPERIAMGNVVIDIDRDVYLYDGNPKKPVITAIYEDDLLTEGEDYTIAIENNVNEGYGSITLTGINGYIGETVRTFRIVSKAITPVDSGTCGDSATWAIDENGTILISGSGEMTDYTSAEPAPWDKYIKQIKLIIIDDGIESIGNRSFWGTYALESIYIGNSVKRIGSVSVGSNYINSISLPDSVVDIGSSGLCDSNVQYLHLGKGLKTIGEYAFDGNVYLKAIIIPDGVASIAENAFIGCTGLHHVYFCGDAPEMEWSVFYNVEAKAYYPAGNETWTEHTKQGYMGRLTWLEWMKDQLTDISEAQIIPEKSEYTYNGYYIRPAVKVMLGDIELTEDDYNISYDNNRDPGTGTIIVNGKGKYYGTVTKDFTILKADHDLKLSAADISLKAGESAVITVQNSLGALTVSVDNENTVSAELADNNRIKVTGLFAGSAILTVQDSGNTYYNSDIKTVNITVADDQMTDISEAQIIPEKSEYTYNGYYIRPAVKVMLGDIELTEDDYNISYDNNRDPGTGTIIVNGKGKYYGTVTKDFTILKADHDLKLSAADISLKAGESTEITVQNSLGALTVSVDNENTVFAELADNNRIKVTGLSAGSAILTVQDSGNTYYNSDIKTVNITVTKTEDIVPETVSITPSSMVLIYSETSKATAIITPDDAIDKTVKWSSSDTSVVTVDQKGNIKGVKPGLATITAAAVNGLTAECEVRVLFTDVADSSAYFYSPVYWAVDNHITVGAGGAGKFSPGNPCTREQIVTFLWRLQGEPEPESYQSFTDVKPTDWFYKPISWAASKGITVGLNDGTGRFGVGQPCTREQCVTFLHRTAGKPAVTSYSDFTDVANDRYFYDAISWAASKKITVGLNDGTGRFGVGQTCTRAMIVTFLYRFAHTE